MAALQVKEGLQEAITEGQVRVIIFEWFGRYFGEEIMGDEWASLKDYYLKVAAGLLIRIAKDLE